MCGIVGYISQNDKLYQGAKDHFMRYALALDTLRGEDSTGLVTLRKRFTVNTLKTMMPGDQFVHSQEYLKKYRTGWAQFGHNRAATRGKVTIDNAHPFIFGDVTLAHNGTLWGGGDSISTYDEKLEVDSMQIAYALSQYPPEKAPEVLKQIDGAFALVWTDRRDESINICRNAERPLHFTFNQKKNVMWYMSDGHHLLSINKSFGNHECKGQSVFEIDRMKLLKFKKGDLRPEVIPFSPFVRPAPAKTSSTTGTGGKDTKNGGGTSALKRATERWNNTLPRKDGASTTKSTSGSTVKLDLMGRKRKVPSPMLRVLQSELYLSPDDLCQFQPEDGVEMPDGRYAVYGTMLHPVWNDTPFEMTLYNVPKVQYRAYKDSDWLVRPIGMTHPHEFDQNTGAVLGLLVHCAWDEYAKKYSKSSADDKEEAPTGKPSTQVEDMDSAGNILVPGPSGEFITQSQLASWLDTGCINCGKDLNNEPIGKCVVVNDGKDLICSDCVDDLQVGMLATETTIN